MPIDPQELERLVDHHSLLAVVRALVDICQAKSDHIATNWQDELLARRWWRYGAVLERAAQSLSRGK